MVSYEKQMICYISEVGQNNFYYPSETKAILSDDCEVHDLMWLGGTDRNLRPVKVKNSCLHPMDLKAPSADKILSKDDDAYSVVWIENA
jgi:hypothetical protein